jgi:hypothetical protein
MILKSEMQRTLDLNLRSVRQGWELQQVMLNHKFVSGQTLPSRAPPTFFPLTVFGTLSLKMGWRKITDKTMMLLASRFVAPIFVQSPPLLETEPCD